LKSLLDAAVKMSKYFIGVTPVVGCWLVTQWIVGKQMNGSSCFLT